VRDAGCGAEDRAIWLGVANEAVIMTKDEDLPGAARKNRMGL